MWRRRRAGVAGPVVAGPVVAVRDSGAAALRVDRATRHGNFFLRGGVFVGLHTANNDSHQHTSCELVMVNLTQTRPHRARLESAHKHQNPKENRPAIRESWALANLARFGRVYD